MDVKISSDKYTYYALVIPSVTKFIFCLFKLRSLSKDLADIQNDCNENSIILNKKNYNINEKMGKPMKTVLIWWYGMKFVICQISLTFLLLGSAYKFQEIFNWSDIGKLDVLSFFNFWILFYFSPLKKIFKGTPRDNLRHSVYRNGIDINKALLKMMLFSTRRSQLVCFIRFDIKRDLLIDDIIPAN